MDLAGGVSGAVACVVAGCLGVRGCGESSREVGGTGRAAADVRWEADARRFDPRDGKQELEIWHVSEPLVAIDAARSESWDLSSRSDYDFAAAAWSAADLDGPDAL